MADEEAGKTEIEGIDAPKELRLARSRAQVNYFWAKTMYDAVGRCRGLLDKQFEELGEAEFEGKCTAEQAEYAREHLRKAADRFEELAADLKEKAELMNKQLEAVGRLHVAMDKLSELSNGGDPMGGLAALAQRIAAAQQQQDGEQPPS